MATRRQFLARLGSPQDAIHIGNYVGIAVSATTVKEEDVMKLHVFSTNSIQKKEGQTMTDYQ